MSKPWGIGDWAADVEREEREQAAAATATAAGGSQSFPSLRESVTAKPKKKKMTLTEFYSETSSGGVRPKGLTPNEMLLLPTGPKERSAEEMQLGRLGGGFSNYGRGGPRGGGREDSGEGGGGGRRQYGGFEDERRGPSDLPSRADEVDNWATAKKVLPSADSGRPGRYGSLGGAGGGGGFGGGSRADEVDNWGNGKKLAPPPTRSSTFGSGFRDSPGAEADRWSRGGGGGGFGGGGGGGGFGGGADNEPLRERPRLMLDPRKGGLGGDLEPVRTSKPSPFGAARPREEVLAEKGLDWKKLDVEIETKKSSSQSSRPTSAHSSRPSSAHSSRSEGVQQQGSLENVVSKPKPKVNPFGEAKPREVLLQERGQDWRKIDLELEHRRVERPETEEEKALKEEINHLKQDLLKESAPKEGIDSAEVSGGTQLVDTIAEKEKELETLTRDLDDKVRFRPKVVERPGSGAGRSAGFHERPPSQSGPGHESRNTEFADRPRSRGTPEIWSRQSDERRSFHGTGFLGSREFDRPRSREGW